MNGDVFFVGFFSRIICIIPYVKSKYSSFGNCRTISATTFQVGINDADKSRTNRFANAVRSPALLMFEFGSDTVFRNLL